MSEKTYNILFAGVGGQGTLLMAEITAMAALAAGFEVKQTEVHGVSQRGGSVETHVRFGPNVWSPVITPGLADIVVGLEKLEALRFAHFAHITDGTIFVNDFEIIPASVANAEGSYPHTAIDFLRSKGYAVIALEASKIALDLGDSRMANVVMIGAMSSHLTIPQDIWLQILRKRFPERFREPNLKAFAAGCKLSPEPSG